MKNILNKKEYNSDRRRKHDLLFRKEFTVQIRKNITPIGDGNTCFYKLHRRLLLT